MYRPTEIRNLNLAVYTNKDVLGLDIAMNDVFFVQVFQGARHLGDILRCLPFWKSLLFSQVLVQLSFSSKFEDQEYAFRIVEVTVEF